MYTTLYRDGTMCTLATPVRLQQAKYAFAIVETTRILYALVSVFAVACDMKKCFYYLIERGINLN